MLDRTKDDASAAEAFLSPPAAEYAAALERWFWAEFNAAAARAGYGAARRLALPMLAYGDYVDRFLDLTLPSLLAAGNVGALDCPLILAHTDERGAQLLQKVAGLITKHGQLETHVVPEYLIDNVPSEESNKYWLLGAAQQLHMQMAKCAGYDYHMLYPDVVYGQDFFANLMRMVAQGKRAILHGSISARLEDVAPIMKEKNCALPGPELNALALDHLHPQMAQFVVNARTDYPPVPLFLFAGDGAFHSICPHMNIVFLGHEHLMRVPLVLFNTVDAALAQIIPEDVEISAPSRDDGLSWIELSDAGKVVTPNAPCDLGEMAIRFWVMCWCNGKYLRYLDLDPQMPLPAGYAPPWPAMSEADIVAYKAKVRAAIRDAAAVSKIMFPMVADAFQRGRKWR